MIRSVVVIGPSGNGKSTLARALADRLGWHFIEGDDHHPPANIARMARGEPLSDADRAPFLASIGQALAQADGAVASCSALKRSYRQTLERIGGPILFVWPKVARAELLRRMEQRQDHFMPPSLLDSQIAAFEPPASGERAMVVDALRPPAELAAEIAAEIATKIV